MCIVYLMLMLVGWVSLVWLSHKFGKCLHTLGFLVRCLLCWLLCGLVGFVLSGCCCLLFGCSWLAYCVCWLVWLVTIVWFDLWVCCCVDCCVCVLGVSGGFDYFLFCICVWLLVWVLDYIVGLGVWMFGFDVVWCWFG